MTIIITPTQELAAQLKNKAGNVGSSLPSLASGMESLATHLQNERNRPLSDFLVPIKITIGARLGSVPARLQGNLKAQAIFELGFRVSVALRQAENWIVKHRPTVD